MGFFSIVQILSLYILFMCEPGVIAEIGIIGLFDYSRMLLNFELG